MPESEAFLKAICDNPDDDGPRLIYADWLEENGDPERAEFIRVQCALEKMEKYGSPFDGLRKREEQLLEAHWSKWIVPFCKVFGEPLPRKITRKPFWHLSRWLSKSVIPPSGLSVHNYELRISKDFHDHWIYPRTEFRKNKPSFRAVQFHRGFVDHIELAVEQVQMVHTLLTAFTIIPITSLNLSNSPSITIIPLLLQNQFLQIRRLTLNQVDESVLHEIVTSSYCRGLKDLSLSVDSYRYPRSDLHPLGLISQSRHLEKLKHISLAGFNLSLQEVQALIASPLIDNLEYLSFYDTKLSDEIASLIAESDRFRNSKCYLWVECSVISEEAKATLHRALEERFGEYPGIDFDF